MNKYGPNNEYAYITEHPEMTINPQPMSDVAITSIYDSFGKRITNPVDIVDEYVSRSEENEKSHISEFTNGWIGDLEDIKSSCAVENYGKEKLNTHSDLWWYMYQRPWLKKILRFSYSMIGK